MFPRGVGVENGPLSLGDHVESRGNKTLFLHGTPRPDANSVRGLPCKKQSSLLPRDSTWPPSDKGLLESVTHSFAMSGLFHW